MDKNKLFYKYTDFTALQSIGNGWLSQIKSYLPFGSWVATASVYQIALWAININWIPYWSLIVLLAVKFYIMIFINWLAGRIGIKIGLLRAQQQYTTKSEHLSPYEVQRRKTLESIAEKVGAKSFFDKL